MKKILTILILLYVNSSFADEICVKKCGEVPRWEEEDNEIREKSQTYVSRVNIYKQCIEKCNSSKSSNYECIFNHTNIKTGEILNKVVHRCDFVQSKEDMTKTQIVIMKGSANLVPEMCNNKSCEEITDTYVICNGERFEKSNKVFDGLKNAIKEYEEENKVHQVSPQGTRAKEK